MTDRALTRWVELDGTRRILPLDAPLTVVGALEFARSFRATSTPGMDDTRESWELLATLACADLGAARAIEPHLDAQSILREARAGGVEIPAESSAAWGVFAAEGGQDPLVATLSASGWMLRGTKPWCSLADRLDRALVTASSPDGTRRLFAVDLRDAGVTVQAGVWHARGLTEIPSGPVRFTGVPADPVGPPGWYLRRVGFAWGGIGVAACWFGGAVGIARSLFEALALTDASALQLVHLGAVDELIESARLSLCEAARIVDAEPVPPREAASILAKRVRATVARCCEEIILRSGHALGPAPLALDPVHAKRVADLQLYIRQHHAERDQASLGSAILAGGEAPW
ncbi:acyl-CoA dehydrogenase [Glaciihabitans sp. INWT7]|uniref:acyl-CoA dehydrogenase n=1 Tax=Glaciihabitans sp. INWT7 TaxID=2596912 RepID=UPI001CA5A98F|nr:acyl-CoA dehydrogenase [Glaciihabitans sp. INWT7]